MGFPNMSPQQPSLSHSPQPMNILPQHFGPQQMQMFHQQQQERFGSSNSGFSATSFNMTSQATFGQPQAQFLAPAAFVQPPMINNLNNQAGASAIIADLDSQQNIFEDQNISENLSGQLRMCGINSNDPGEMLSVDNMSTDSFFKI